MNTAAYDWLLVLQSYKDIKSITNVLNASEIRFDQNLIVSYPTGKLRLIKICESNFIYNSTVSNIKKQKSEEHFRNRNYCRFGNKNNQTCIGLLRYNTEYYKKSRFRNLVKNKFYTVSEDKIPLIRSGLVYNYSQKFEMTNISKLIIKDDYHKQPIFPNFISTEEEYEIKVLQLFKVRYNSTLYAHLLGKHKQHIS